MSKSKAKPITENLLKVKFKDGLRSARIRALFLDGSRKNLPFNLISESLEWTLRQRFYPFALFPDANRQLGQFVPFNSIPFKREIEWVKTLILLNSGKLNLFVDLRKKLERETLLGNYDGSKEILDIIRAEFGVSFWWIKHSIAVLQLADGIEGQKQFANEMKSSFPPRSLISYIIHQISVRNEPSVTPSRFATQVNEDIKRWTLHEEWKVVGRYHLFEELPDNVETALTILRYSEADSLVDLYDAFLYLCKSYACIDGDDKDKIHLGKTLEQLSEKIVDTRLCSIRFLLSDTRVQLESHETLETYNAFLSSDFITDDEIRRDNAQQSVGQYLIEAVLPVKSEISGALSSKISKYLSDITAKNNSTESSAGEVDRLALAFPGFDVIQSIQAISNSLLTHIPLNGKNLIHVNEREHSRIQARLLFAFSPIIHFHPLIIELLPRTVSKKLIDSSMLNNEIVVDKYPWIRPVDHRLYYIQEKKVNEILRAIDVEDYGKVVTDSKLLRMSGLPAYEMFGMKYLSYGLLRNGDVKDCVELVTREYIKNPNCHFILPIRDLADTITKDMAKEMSGDPSLTIMYHIYSRHIDGAYEHKIRKSVSEMLVRNGVTRPSYLRNDAFQFEKEKLIYFLRYGCLPEVIYMTGDYESSRELLEERNKILEWLIYLDQNNIEEYQAEIVNKTRHIVLQARKAEVEQRKIELNLDGYLREAEKTVRESYDRYIAYQHSNLGNLGMTNKIAEVANSSSTPLLPTALPQDEVSALFRSMVVDLLNIFTRDRNYGLDGFLATRIRHNVLESELRSPLVAARLITTLDSNGQYRFNAYWLGSNQIQDTEYAYTLNNYLSDFARQYDALLLEIKNHWVQIKRDGSDIGMIEVMLDEQSLGQIEALVKDLNTPFDDFAQSLFMYFVKAIEPGLASIRERLNDEAKSRALTLVDDLEKCLLDSIEKNSYPLLNAIRDVRGAILRAFDRVIEWFRLANEISNDPLPLSHVIQISIEISQHFNPRFDADLALGDAGEISVPGVLITAYTDIFIVFFDNVINRSGLTDSPKVNIAATVVDGKIVLTLENCIGPDVDKEKAKMRLAKIMQSLVDGSYRERIRGESGTGLSRVFDIISVGFRFDPQLKAEIVNNIFKAEFSLPIKIGTL
jgi:hypothetical protein